MDKKFTWKPDLGQTLKQNKEYSYYHPGKWTRPQIHDNEMWTCCASEDKGSRVF